VYVLVVRTLGGGLKGVSYFLCGFAKLVHGAASRVFGPAEAMSREAEREEVDHPEW
jgi:hypothetical protein